MGSSAATRLTDPPSAKCSGRCTTVCQQQSSTRDNICFSHDVACDICGGPVYYFVTCTCKVVHVIMDVRLCITLEAKKHNRQKQLPSRLTAANIFALQASPSRQNYCRHFLEHHNSLCSVHATTLHSTLHFSRVQTIISRSYSYTLRL